MRSELGFEPKWTTVEAFDDFVRGRGLTPIIKPEWVRSAEAQAIAAARRWVGDAPGPHRPQPQRQGG